MTSTQQAEFSKALTRAIAQGIRIAGCGTRKADGARVWIVEGQGNTYHVVQVSAHSLTCSCPAGQAGKYCKHRSVVTARLMDQAAGDRALALAERHTAKAEVLATAHAAAMAPAPAHVDDLLNDMYLPAEMVAPRGPRMFR